MDEDSYTDKGSFTDGGSYKGSDIDEGSYMMKVHTQIKVDWRSQGMVTL